MTTTTPPTRIFLARPEEVADRVLYAAQLTEVRGRMLSAKLDDEGLDLQVGDAAFLFFEMRNDFVKQPVRIRVLMDSGEAPAAGMEMLGEPVSADGRQCFRVSPQFRSLGVDVDGETGCMLLDVSVSGLACIAATRHRIGDTLRIALPFEGDVYEGPCCVQNIVPLEDGRFRYGLHCVERRISPASLKRGLQRVTMTLQRDELRRRRARQ